MLTIVLGAPGSGKSTIAGDLREEAASVVIDWDAFMPAAALLAGRDVRASPEQWAPYRELVRSVVEEVGSAPTIVLGVCTPDELTGWPDAQWILLDCDDRERSRRLLDRPPDEVEEAIADAADYRQLSLPRVDITGLTPREAAASLANLIDHR